MKDTLDSQRAFWQEHFRNQHLRKSELGIHKSMDYPSHRLQVQTYAHVLEGLGPLQDQSLFDAGCGWGVFTRMAHLLGASPVGVDFVPETIHALRNLCPEIRWETADLAEPSQLEPLGVFDRVAAVEVLQHMDFRSTLATLWNLVAPGGRLVACVPNSLCPSVPDVQRRHSQWVPVAPREITHAASTFPGCSAWYMQGLTYLRDQTFLPYAASDWGPQIHGTPNRIVFTMVRA
jgi:2-polyprenyl-3-methyl-5-hydroxy-6-metoxy-1,4-benzoquinol methylase